MFEFSLPYWALLALGSILVAGEVVTGAFIILWFGLGLIATGLITLMFPELNVGVQLLLASLSGGVMLYSFRDRCVGNQNAEPLPPYTFSQGRGSLLQGQDGGWRVLINGTYWQIANIGESLDSQLQEGQFVTVTSFEDNRAVIDWNDA